MINKTIYLFSIMLILATSAMLTSCEEHAIKFNRLPENAQEFITTHFAGITINHIIMDRDEGRKEYDVYLSDGTNLHFDENGNWREIECPFTTLPSGILPEAITTDLDSRHPQAHISKAEKEIGGYILDIIAGDGAKYELRYSQNGDFISQNVDMD